MYINTYNMYDGHYSLGGPTEEMTKTDVSVLHEGIHHQQKLST